MPKCKERLNLIKTDKVVYTIAVFTEEYINKERNGKLVEQNVLIHNSNLFNLEGQEFDVFGHKLIYLNHNYIKNSTPQGNMLKRQKKVLYICVYDTTNNKGLKSILFRTFG